MNDKTGGTLAEEFVWLMQVRLLPNLSDRIYLTAANLSGKNSSNSCIYDCVGKQSLSLEIV